MPTTALSAIPDALRTPLIEEYSQIVNNFMERRWGPAELSGGRFCEVVYTILHGHAQNAYALSPTKPANFVNACRALENNAGVPRSFQILIPRLLPALYEIRNNRNVGHIGGDVDPDFMDCSMVLATASWIMAELIRVFHNVTTDEAQTSVDALAERRMPLVWKSGSIRRVLRTDLQLRDQILILMASATGRIATDELFTWTGYSKRAYFNRLLAQLHDQRLVEYHRDTQDVEMLPPGSDFVSRLLQN